MSGIFLKAVILAAISVMAGAAAANTVVVSGTSDPFLTGYGAGGSVTIDGATDYAPFDSPVLLGPVVGGEDFTFHVTGLVSNCPCSTVGPNGGYGVSASGGTTVGGFNNFPINSLVGVFYDPSAPQGGVNSSLTTLTPGVNQVFYIGDGSLGSFVAPTGATQLYLATVDGYQWSNNVGAFTVTTGVPEPATWAMLLAGFSALGFAGYRRKAEAVAA